jgi:TonB family protein
VRADLVARLGKYVAIPKVSVNLADAKGWPIAEGPGPAGLVKGALSAEIRPEYPAEAVAAHVAGLVVLDGVVTKRGTIEKVTVVGGPQALRQSALDAVKQWRWKPYLDDGVAIDQETRIGIQFVMDGVSPAVQDAQVARGIDEELVVYAPVAPQVSVPLVVTPALSMPASAAEVLCQPRVVGNQRVPTESILSRLLSRRGGPYDAATVQRDVDGLREAGYFSSVRIERVGAAKCVQLVVHVVEKPGAEGPAQATRVMRFATEPQRAVLLRAQIAAQPGTEGPPAPQAKYVPGIEILSNTEGVEEFMDYISRLSQDIKRNWEPLIPDEVRAPLLKKGVVGIRFTILPDGKIASPMVLENRSGDVALDRAAWGAITSEGKFEPLPKEFHGPKLELRIGFFYNTRVPEGREGGESSPKAPSEPAARSMPGASPGAVTVREASYEKAGAAEQAEGREGAAASGEPLRVSAGQMAGNLISRPDPVYPPIAKAAHVQGAVVLRAVISKTGEVTNYAVASGPEMLRGSAIDAVKQWKYKPYLVNGMPMEVETTITVNFTFGDGTVLETLPGTGRTSDQAMLESALAQSRAGYYDAARLGLRTLLMTYPESSLVMAARLAVADSWYLEGTPAALEQAAEAYKSFLAFYPNGPEAAKARARLAQIAGTPKKIGDRVSAPAGTARRVSPGMMVRLKMDRSDPTYPAEAKAARVQGAVVLDAVISKEGKIERLKLLSGPEMLQSSALDAVKRWTFRPYLVDGAPVDLETTITVNYTFGL